MKHVLSRKSRVARCQIWAPTSEGIVWLTFHDDVGSQDFVATADEAKAIADALLHQIERAKGRHRESAREIGDNCWVGR